MEFCCICPTTGLERWGTALSKRHLVLAQNLYNKEYLKYYANRKRAGDFLILDNGAYENTKPLDSDAYFNYIKGLDPDVVILPDILMSPWRETTSVALRFLDTYAGWLEDHNYRTQWMFVPQVPRAKDSNSGYSPHAELELAVETVLNDGRVGKYVTWIGLGRYLHTEFINMTPVARRAKLAKEWRKHGVRFHALGMASGNLDELKQLRDAGVESIDSSAPVWRGWNAIPLNSEDGSDIWKSVGTPCDFSSPLPEEGMQTMIDHNLEVIRNVING